MVEAAKLVRTGKTGLKAADFVTTRGLKALSIEKLPPMVGRGVLIDMTRHFNQNPLPEGTVFNEAEIKAQASAQGVVIGKGDIVLFHTGWLNLAGKDCWQQIDLSGFRTNELSGFAAGPRGHGVASARCCKSSLPTRLDRSNAVGGVIHALSTAPVPDIEKARWAKGG